MEPHQKPITQSNIRDILGVLDYRLDVLFQWNYPKDYFFLAGGWAVLAYKILDRWERGRALSKDLDFIWIQNWKYNELFVETLNENSERLVIRDWLMEPYPSDETFISLDMFSEIEWDKSNRYLIEFMASRNFIEKDSEYSQEDFRQDILQYFTNEDFNYLKYIKVCTPFVTWYTRLVTFRDEYWRLFVGSSIEDSDYYLKNYKEIAPALKKKLISIQEIEDNIGYLVHKYYKNSPIVIWDYNKFIENLKNEFWY